MLPRLAPNCINLCPTIQPPYQTGLYLRITVPTEAQLRQILPRASKDTIALNAKDQHHGKPSSAKPKQPVRNRAMGKAERETTDSGRIRVSLTAYRARECDPDNLIGKYFVDCLRMSHLIPDDTEKDIVYQISQKKVEKKTQEKTLVEVIYP